jgi:ATP-dependent DNA helicase RecG
LETLPAPLSITDLAETLVALANGRGGQVRLRGQPADELIDRVREAALKAAPILVIPTPTVEKTGDVIVTVPYGLPHVFSIDGRYIIRHAGDNRPLPAEELRRLLIDRGGIHYEEETPRGATLDDIDWRKAEDYAERIEKRSLLNRRGMARDVLVQRGCLARREKDLAPTYAGILLFGRDPGRFLRSATITAARFAGTTMGDTFTKQDIGGTLPDQIRAAELFLFDHLRRGVQLGAKMARDEQTEYPMEAARELVVNAVAHRDYSIAGDGIRLFIFADHLEVISPGLLPGPVTIDNIVDERYSRNSVVVQILSDMGFIERLGYGVDRVIALMQDRDLPPPEFTETAGGFRVRLFNARELTPGNPQVAPEPEITEENDILNPRQIKALNVLKNGSLPRITNKDLQELFPDVHAETIRRDLADLVNRGMLVKLGQKRGSYYILRRVREGDKT